MNNYISSTDARDRSDSFINAFVFRTRLDSLCEACDYFLSAGH